MQRSMGVVHIRVSDHTDTGRQTDRQTDRRTDREASAQIQTRACKTHTEKTGSRSSPKFNYLPLTHLEAKVM